MLDLSRVSPAALSAIHSDLERWDAGRLSHLDWSRRFLSHYCTSEPSHFHAWLSDQLDTLNAHRGRKLSVIAPRESAKSTFTTVAYVLRCALEGREPYICVLSDTVDQAEQYLGQIREEIEANELIQFVYGDACWKGAKKGGGNANQLRFGNGVRIKAFGRGSPIRGRRSRQNRPSLILVDDCQRNEDMMSETLRTTAINWFLGEVIPAGSPSTNFISVGSALHREAISVQTQTLPGWSGKTFPAIESWPKRFDLWYHWEMLLSNLADEHRIETAQRHYESHRAEMLEGARSFWPSFKPIVDLMTRRAEIGPRRFDIEYQGVPGTPEGAEWPAEYFSHAGLWFEEWPRDLSYLVLTLDPSKGASDSPGDYQAHCLVGLDRKGTIYVECECRREPVPRMVDRSVDLAIQHRPFCIAVETNQGLDLLLPEFERCKQAKKLNFPLPVQGILQTESKVFRIRRLGSYLSRRQIRIRKTAGGETLVQQLREFPCGSHDDAPDALEMGIRRLETLTKGIK